MAHKIEGMTVGELKDLLEFEDDNAIVVVSYPSGDFWRRDIAKTLYEGYQAEIKWSDYHRTWMESQTESDEDSDDEDSEDTENTTKYNNGNENKKVFLLK